MQKGKGRRPVRMKKKLKIILDKLNGGINLELEIPAKSVSGKAYFITYLDCKAL